MLISQQFRTLPPRPVIQIRIIVIPCSAIHTRVPLAAALVAAALVAVVLAAGLAAAHNGGERRMA
jgi:hypothetical protein